MCAQLYVWKGCNIHREPNNSLSSSPLTVKLAFVHVHEDQLLTEACWRPGNLRLLQKYNFLVGEQLHTRVRNTRLEVVEKTRLESLIIHDLIKSFRCLFCTLLWFIGGMVPSIVAHCLWCRTRGKSPPCNWSYSYLSRGFATPLVKYLGSQGSHRAAGSL